MNKISVVVPSYNQGQFIEETLLSIIDQGYPLTEIIVIDGGSRDDTVSVIKKYEDKIAYWVSEKDKGQSDAINKGFAKATGDIITWLCSDDLFTPGTLHKVNEHFSGLPESTGVIHGGVILFKEDKDLELDFGYPDPSKERNVAGMAFSQPAAFLRKKYLDAIGGKVSEELHYGMDFDMFSRLAAVCEFQPVKDTYAKYRLHESSKTVSQQDKFIIDWCRVFVNFCKNAGWNETLAKLKTASPLEEAFGYYYPYQFSISRFENADSDKALFYHLCYQLRSFYASGKLKEAGTILKYLKKNYPADLLKNEKMIGTISKRMLIPSSLIMFLRKIRGKA